MDDVRALLDQGIDADVVTQLIESQADLRDIAVNVQILLDGGVRIELINEWLQEGVKLDGVAALLDRGIDVDVVTKLVENKADLRDITVNAQILLDEGVRVDLVNGWLGNKTHLNSAILIINRGVDLNLVGTSSKVKDFAGLKGAHPNEIVSRIPADAKIERWKPDPAGVQEGMKFEWQDVLGKTWRLEMHGPDLNPALPAWSNAARGWVLRIKHKKQYMDAAGTFYKDTIEEPRSPNYNPLAINDTHIPIQAP